MKIRLLAALALLAAGCAPDDPGQVRLDIQQPAGVDALENYVAIGDGLMAGFMDAGLVTAGQNASVARQIAGALGYGSSRPFWQPLIQTPGVGVTSTGDANLVAGVLAFTAPATIAPLGITARAQVPALLLASTVPVPYHDLAVPGATVADVVSATTSANSQAAGNSYFDLILRNPTFGGVTMLDQAISKGPTLVTLWIGEANILGGARSGEPAVGTNITPAAMFQDGLDAIVTRLVAGVRDRFGYEPTIVVGNLRSLTAVPFFVPKAVFDAVAGAAIPTEEPRADVAYMLFTALQLISQPGFTPPIPQAYTLTGDEAAVIETAVDDYNTAILAVAGSRGCEVADIHAMFAALDDRPAVADPDFTHFLFLVRQGMSVDDAAQATLFSLDGIHPNNRGYSLVANAFIAAINQALGLTGDAAVDPVPVQIWDPTYGAR